MTPAEHARGCVRGRAGARARSSSPGQQWVLEEAIDRTPSPESLYVCSHHQSPPSRVPPPAPMVLTFAPVVLIPTMRGDDSSLWQYAEDGCEAMNGWHEDVFSSNADSAREKRGGLAEASTTMHLHQQAQAERVEDDGATTPRLRAGGACLTPACHDEVPIMKSQSWADVDEEPIEEPPADDYELSLSKGSVGHSKGSCAAPCKYHGKARGCKDGVECDHCHICKFSSSSGSSSAWVARRHHMWSRRRRQQQKDKQGKQEEQPSS